VEKRGKKRDYDEASTGARRGSGGAGGAAPGQNGILPIAKSLSGGGAAGVPRAMKKQRMDMAGQARDIPTPTQQQPTPQGV